MVGSFTMVVMITVDMMVLRTTMITTMKLYWARYASQERGEILPVMQW
jgi:hypothetical protein